MILTGISILGELTPRSLDHILSFGERLSAPLLAYELSTRGLPTKVLTGGEAGLITDSSFGEANPVWRETRRRVRRVLKPLLESNTIPVITGFIGQTSGGEVTTLGRGWLRLYSHDPGGRPQRRRGLDMDRCRWAHDGRPPGCRGCPGDRNTELRRR